jgi:hypothetical protein
MFDQFQNFVVPNVASRVQEVLTMFELCRAIADPETHTCVAAYSDYASWPSAFVAVGVNRHVSYYSIFLLFHLLSFFMFAPFIPYLPT